MRYIPKNQHWQKKYNIPFTYQLVANPHPTERGDYSDDIAIRECKEEELKAHLKLYSKTHSFPGADNEHLNEESMLANIPTEIKLHILELLEAEKYYSTMACLGVTCRSFYNLFKVVHPEPISLSYHCVFVTDSQGNCSHYWEQWRRTTNICLTQGEQTMSIFYLYTLLNKFMGPKYRLGAIVPIFFDRSVYGDVDLEGCATQQEMDWYRRLWDYQKTHNLPRMGDLLPKPHGLGEEWYPICKKILRQLDYKEYWEKLARETGNLVMDAKFNMRRLNIWKKVREEVRYDALEEWIEMVGF